MTGCSIVASLDGDMRRILPLREGNLRKQFPSAEFDDGLHLAEVSLAAGHPSRVYGIFIPNEPGRLGRPPAPTQRVKTQARQSVRSVRNNGLELP